MIIFAYYWFFGKKKGDKVKKRYSKTAVLSADGDKASKTKLDKSTGLLAAKVLNVRTDRRIIKTKGRIFEAFMKLIRISPPDKIKVKDICEQAHINKTTFYKHYVDSTELSAEIDEYLTDKVVDSFEGRESLFEKPEEYVEGLSEAIERETEGLTSVYRGRMEILCAKLEKKLRQFYEGRAESEEKRVMLSFAISGVVRVLIERIFANKSEGYDKKVLSKYLMTALRRVIPLT